MISWSFKLPWRSLSTSVPTLEDNGLLKCHFTRTPPQNIVYQYQNSGTLHHNNAMMSGAKLVANRKISAAYVVRDSDCQVCGATWSQPSTFIKLTCSWRSLIFTNVHLEVNMEQNGWYERYFDVLYTCLCQYFEIFTTTDVWFKLFDNACTVMYYWRWTVSIITQLGGLKKNK